MSEQQTPPRTEGTTQSSGDTWQEVGKQFQTMGESLAAAMRTAWKDEQNQRRMQEVKKGLETMLLNVSQAINDTAKTPQAQEVKSEAKRAAESLRVATEHTMQEMRPQIVSALQKVNEELQKLVARLEKDKPA